MATEVELLSRQVELMERMNSLLIEQTEKLNALSGAMGAQSQVAQEAAGAIEGHSAAMETAGGAAEGATSKLGGFSEMFSSMAQKMKSFLGDGIFNSFSNGIELLGINFGSLADIITNPVGAAMGFLGQAWDIIMKKVREVYDAMIRLAQAMEKIREKFGSFNENTSRRTREAFENLGSTIKTTRENAAAFGSKFAPGFEGAEQRLDKVLEIATDLSPVIDLLGQQFNDAADQMYLLKEGLGFSGEALKQTAVLSQLAGKNLKGFSEEIMSTINKIGKNLGISTKVLGQDVGKALTNFKMLGRMTGDYVKEITKAAVFTRKLGIELNELSGLVDKFDEFEGGAEAAAQLAQGFGMVLDPLKMMGMEVGPRLQEMQRAFMATGRSIESMSRQERKLLADTAGLTEEQALLAFSSKGMSMSYDQIAAGAEGATKQQKTMDQIMNDVLDNIPNIIVGLKAATGFIEAFVEGIMTGFGRQLLPTLTYLAKKMGEVFAIGLQVGDMLFGKLFPPDPTGKTRPLLEAIKGVGDMFVTIATVLKQLLGYAGGEGVDSAELFADGISVIFDSIQKTFGNFFSQINIGEIIANGAKFIADLASAVVKWLTGPQGITSIAASLRGAFKRKEGTTTEGGVAGSLLDGMKTAFDTLLVELPKLGPQLLELGEALIEMLFDFFENFPITSLFVTGGPILTTLGGIVSNFFSTLGTLFGNPSAAAGSEMTEAGSKMQMGIGQGIANAATTVVEGGKNFLEKLGDIVMDAAKIAAFAGGIAVAINVIGGAIHDVMMTFVEPQDGRDKSFIQLMADASRSFADVDAGSITATGVILGGIVVAIAGMVGGLAYAASQLTSVGLEGFIAMLGTAAVAGSLVYFVRRLGVGIADMLVEIVGNFGSPAFISSVKAMEGVNFKPLMSLVEAISQMVKLSVGLLDVIDIGITDFSGDSVASIVDLSANLRDMMMGGPKAGTKAGEGLIANLAAIKLTNEDSTKFISLAVAIPSMATVFENIGKMATTLAGLPDLAVAKEKTIGLHTLLMYIETLGERMSQHFPEFTSDVTVSVKNFSDAMTSIGSVVTSLVNLTNLEGAYNNLLNLTGVEGGKTGLVNALGVLAVWINDSFGPTKAITDDVKTNIANMSSSIDVIGQMGKGLEGIEDFADSVEDVTKRLTDAKMAEFEGTLTRVVQHVKMINDALKDLDTVGINATIDRVGNNMKIAKQTLQLAGGAVKVNVQLNLTVNTEKMAQALVLGGFVAPTQEYGDAMQADYNDGVFDGLNQSTLNDLSSTGASQFTYPPMSP